MLILEYVIRIWNLNQALNHGLILKKVHRVIKFNQNRKEKELFSIINKLSCYKSFQGKFISSRNGNNSTTNE